MTRALTALTALTISLAGLSGTAHALEAEQRVLKQVTVEQADGTKATKYVDADLVTPGETIVYALVFRNDKEEPAEDVVLVMPVPSEIVYVENSADTDVAATGYSVDGGETFAPRAALRVRQDDGSARPAEAEEITHIRWTLAKPVEPGEVGRLWYRGVLK